MSWFTWWSSSTSKKITYTVKCTPGSSTVNSKCDAEANEFRQELKDNGAQSVGLSKTTSNGRVTYTFTYQSTSTAVETACDAELQEFVQELSAAGASNVTAVKT